MLSILEQVLKFYSDDRVKNEIFLFIAPALCMYCNIFGNDNSDIPNHDDLIATFLGIVGSLEYWLAHRLLLSNVPNNKLKHAKLLDKCLEFLNEKEHLVVCECAHEKLISMKSTETDVQVPTVGDLLAMLQQEMLVNTIEMKEYDTAPIKFDRVSESH